MIQFAKLREAVARAYDRHGVKYYTMHSEEDAGILEVDVKGVTMKYNVKYKTLMITARHMSHPRAIPFARWRDRPELTRWGIDRRWWSTFRLPIMESIIQIETLTAEPPAAVEDPDAQQDAPRDHYQPTTAAAVDELLKFQTVVTVSMRDGAHTATA